MVAYACARRVPNHVPNVLEKPTESLNVLTPEAPSEAMVDSIELDVRNPSKLPVQLLHASRKSAIVQLHNQVVVIVHQRVRVDTPAVSRRGTVENLEKHRAKLVGENRLLVVPSG